MSSSFGGSTFDSSSFDNNTNLVQQKKTSLLDKVFQKRTDLGFSSANLKDRSVEALDADTVRINPSVADKAFDPFVKPVDIRLKSNNFGESFNAFETSHGNENDPEVAARLQKQRDTIDNELLHGWFNPATNQDVYDRGNAGKQVLVDKLKQVNEGKTGLDFALGERDNFGRPLGDMKLSNENTSAIDAMNNSEINSAYNTPYNFAKQNKDTATIGQAIEDTGRLALTGFEGIGSALGYGLEKSGIASELGRQIQDEHFKHDKMLRNNLSDPIKQASQQPLLDENNDLNPNFGWTSLATNVIPSIPGSVVMGGAGGVLAKGLGIAGETALGLNAVKVAKEAGFQVTGNKAKQLLANELLSKSVGFGTSEGVFSAAQNADQWGQEQRQKPIEEFKKSSIWSETLTNNKGNEEATKEDLINQGQSDIFKDTTITTGALSGLPGMAGGMYGKLFDAATSGTKISAKGAFINALKGMSEEAAQEYSQSLFERRTTNQATKDYINPNQDISEGQWNDAAVGGLSGFAMGAMGAGGHIASIDKTKIPIDTQTPTSPKNTSTIEDLTPSKVDIPAYEESVNNITDDNRQEVINQGIKDYPVNGTLLEKIQMASAISKARDTFESPEHDAILKQVNAEIQLQNFAKGMPNFKNVISDPNTSIEDIQNNLITGAVDATSPNTGSLFNDIGRTKDADTLNILKGISTAKQKKYADSNTVNDPYVLATTGIETKNLPKESSEIFSAITRGDYKDLNQGLNLLSTHVKSATTPEQKNTGISALTKTISKVYSDKIDVTSATEQTVKQALNTINGLVTNKGTITIEPSDTLEQIHNKILPTFGSQPIQNNGNTQANNLVTTNNNLYNAIKSTSDVSKDKLDGKGLLPSFREHIQIINFLLVNNAPKGAVDMRVKAMADWIHYDATRNELFQELADKGLNTAERNRLEKDLEILQRKGNPFTDNISLTYTFGSKELAKQLKLESEIMSAALADTQDQVNIHFSVTPQATTQLVNTQIGKGLITKTTSAKIQASKNKTIPTTQSTSQTDENALDSTNVNQEDTIEENNMDDIPEKLVTPKEPSFNEEQERIYQEYADGQFQQQEAQNEPTSNEITNPEEDITSEDNTSVTVSTELTEVSPREKYNTHLKDILNQANGNVIRVLELLKNEGKNTKNVLIIPLINLLLKSNALKEYSFELNIAKGGDNKNNIAQHFISEKKIIYFEGLFSQNKRNPLEIIIHEIVHGATKQAVLDNKFTKELETLLNYLKGIKGKDKIEQHFIDKATKNKEELLAYGLTNNVIMGILVKAKNTDKSFFTSFVKAIKQVLGLSSEENSALIKLFSIAENIIDENIKSEFEISIKQEFTPEYQKEIKEFNLINTKNLKPSFIYFVNKVKHSLVNPIPKMFTFAKTKESLFDKYPRLFENLFTLPEFTINTKDGLKAFETLKKEETKFQKAFKESYKEGTFNDDPLVALTNKNVSQGKFDPNIVSAMFMGSIDWLINKGSDTLFNFEKDVQSILAMDENTIPQNKISNALSELGSVRAMVASGLGNNIFNNLKFTASKTYPENEIAKLKLSLGLHALNTLNNMGYVTYSAVENSTFDRFKLNKITNPKVTTQLKPNELQDQSVVFVRIASDIEDKKSVINYSLKQTLDTLKAGSKDITTMFESAYEKELPKTKKPNKASVLTSLGFNEEKGKKATGLHTTQEITNERVNALTEYVQTPHTLDTPTMKLYLAMNEDARAEMELGIDFQEQKQQSKERSYRGKVLSYEKEKEALEKLLELSEQGSKPLYFMSTFWNQGRIGGTGIGHPQNNKWIRNLSSPKNYFVKIKPSDKFAITQFKLAVLEAFGVAAKSLTKEQIDPEFQEILEANQKAINEINKQKEGKDFNQRTIINAVHKGKEKAHTLNGLVALSMYSVTEEFETNIGREVDGITNGVLIGLVLLAGVDNFERMKDVLAAAGLFEDPTMDYATWKNSLESKEDNYEQIARVFAEALDKEEQTPQLLAIKHFIGELLVDDKVAKPGRNFAKPILLLTMFGKSTDKLANSVGDTVIETFYDELEKLQRDTELEWEAKLAKLDVLKKQIETILNKPLQGNEYVEGKVVRNEDDNKASVVELTMNNLLEFSLTQQDVNSIIATVNHLFQPMIEEAINHNFGVTIDNRKILNDAYFVVGEVFKLGLHQELLNFHIPAFKKAYPNRSTEPTKKELEYFKAKQGVEPSAEQMDEIIAGLIKIQPRSPTKNSDSLEQDLQLWNSERSSNHTAAYRTQTGWNSKTGKLKYTVTDKDGEVHIEELDLPKSTTAHALSLIINSLGVGVTIANIHNRDSNVMIDMMKSKFKGLAVHDAFIFNLLEAVEGSKLLNSSLIDSLNSFDVFQGAVDNLERVQEYLKANPDIANELNLGFTSPTEGIFSRQRFYTKDKKTKEITPYYNNLDNFVERLKANQETLATQRQEQIWDHIPKGGVKQYGGQDSYEFIEETKTKPSESNKEEVFISTIQTNKDHKPFDSTPNAKDLLTEKADLIKDITAENIVSEFDTMPKDKDETHNTFLRNFVSQVIAPVVETTELLLFSKATYTYGQYSTELKKVAINLGQALQEQYSPFKMFAQEVFAHEFSHAVTWTAYQMPKNDILKRKIDSLFYAVRREFNKAKTLDSSLTKWDYVFNNTDPIKVDNVPNSLNEVTTTSYDRGIQEFIAFGTTNKEFRDLVKRLQPKQLKVNQVYEGTGSDVIKEASWLETITNIFKKVLDSFMRITKGKDYLEPLTQFDTNVRLILAANSNKPFINITAITDKVEAEIAKKTNEGLKKGLKIIAKGKKSKIQVIRSAAKLADAIPVIGGFETNQTVRQTLKLITNPTARQFALDLVKDVADVNENSKPITNTTIQQNAADAERNSKTDSDENTWSKFVTLNHEQDIALKNLLRGDITTLVDEYGLDKTIELLKNKAIRNVEGKAIANQIPNLKSKVYNLAHLMVYGSNRYSGITEHNAALIAKAGRNIPQDKYQKEMDLVSKLSSIYAIGLQDQNQLNIMVKKLETNPEGMIKIFNIYKANKIQELSEISPLTIIAGKLNTTLDPNKTIFLGTKEDEKALKEWNAKVIGKLERDPNDPLTIEGVLYLVDVKMQNDWDAKAMATTDINPDSSNFQSGIVKTDRFKAAENREKANLNSDGTKTKNTIFTKNNSNISRVAVHNAQGKITNYEYVLDRITQEKYLNPRINVLRDLAAQKNGTTYRAKAYELNHKLVDALHDYWKKLGHSARKDMVWLGAEGEYKDLYNMIPTETKAYITKVFGTENGFYMAQEEIREVFGYRKQSITNWIQPVQADELKKTMGNMIYEQAKRFGLNQANLKALETMWIEGISIAKDTIVVKSGIVSAANESSNFMTAKLAGVPVGFYYKNKISAMKAEQEYRRDSHTYMTHLSNAYADPNYITKEIAQEMSILESTISTNEMSYLHDEGLASTVAEEGSYKDKHQTMLFNKIERARNIFDKLPKVVKDTLKVATISEGTKVYKLLDEIAQMGDITSRHVLIKWEEDKAKQQGIKFDKNKAIDLAKFLFIQYHTVTNDLVQYGNDIGLLMFSKFAVKTLKVLTYMVGQHPARLIALGLFEEIFATTEWIWHTSMNKLANPISAMLATIDASPLVNLTLTPPSYMPKKVFGALDALLPI